MPDGESQILDNNNALDNGEAVANESKQQPPTSQESGGVARIMTAEAFIILPLVVFLDLAGLALIGLDMAFGIGLAFAPAVSLAGYGVLGIWQMSRGMGGNDKGGKLLNDNLLRFIKKQGWKMGLEALPLVDALPMFTSIVYSELKNSNN